MSAVISAFVEQASGADSVPGPRLVSVGLPTPPEGPLRPVRGLLAGAAEVDITPPPGMPKSGHSRNAQDGAGFRTRLRLRVLHLRAGQVSLALVAGDMHAGSAVLQRLVAGEVAAATDIPLGGLLLGATHTHAGPGQYHGSDFYNRWASNRPGLDPGYTAYLASRVVAGVIAAFDSRRPARLAWGSTDVWGLTRNRSLDAHVLNHTVLDKRTASHRRYSAVNPRLHLIRVDAAAPDGDFEPLSAMAVFSIHGTGISRHDPAYNADVWSYITTETADRIERRTGVRPVVGAIEGTHGDVTPAVRPGLLVYAEAERVGRGIGEAAGELHSRLEERLRDDVALGAAYREIDLRRRPAVAGIRLPAPAVGAAKLAGARENSSPLLDRIPPFRPGYPKPRSLRWGAQGAKWVVGGPLQRLVAPAASFPHVLPLQLLTMDGLTLAAVPFEVTVEAGRRLVAGLAGLAGPDGGEIAVTSAANDYWDYLTTPEEYGLQCYEGGSNLYGPATLAFVSAALAELARRGGPDRMHTEAVGDRRFVGQVRSYLAGPHAEGSGPLRRPAGPAQFRDAALYEDGYWEFAWWGGPAGTLDWDRPLVRVESEGPTGRWSTTVDADGHRVDDGGWHLGVYQLDWRAAGRDEPRGPGEVLYAARWFRPPLGAPVRHRFVLEANRGNEELAGEAFD